MKILIAGKDHTSALAGRLALDVNRKGARVPAFLSPQHSALALRSARDSAGYLDILLRLIWLRRGIGAGFFEVQSRNRPLGFLHGKLRSLLWRLLKYQHERIIFQQNTLSELLIGALEFEREQRLLETAELRRRIELLERDRDGRA